MSLVTKLSKAFAICLLLALLSPDSMSAQLTQPLGDLVDAFEWRPIGPANTGGRLPDAEGIPFPSKTFYVATGAGGLWKTTNNGTTFKPIWAEERVAAMVTLEHITEDVLPGAGLTGLMQLFGSDMAKPAPLAEPGVYTLSMTIGDRTLNQPIVVERKGEFKGANSPFEVSH